MVMQFSTWCMYTCICSAQFANSRNFEIALRKLKIVKLQTNFEIAQPSLHNFQIAQESLHDFEIALRKLEIAKLRNAISKVDAYRTQSGPVPFPKSKNLHVGSLTLNTKA